MNKKREELLNKFIEAQKRLENYVKEFVDPKEKVIKKLEEYTNEEKCQFFDKIYKKALRDFEEFEENGTELDEHYMWEEVMCILAKNRNDFWNYYNSLQ